MRMTQRALGVATVAALTYLMWPAARPKTASSSRPNPVRTSQVRTGAPRSIAARLDDLKQPLPGTPGSPRNPFRFNVKPPVRLLAPTPGNIPPPLALPPSGDQDRTPLPPIPIKCIGTARQGRTEVAVFSDGKGLPVWAREGQTVLGEYRLLRIGVESVTISYVDGAGTQTIRIGG